jgi:tyrosyl-tRNA synthetase
MSKFSSEFLNTLSTRGYIHQGSDFDGLDQLAAKKEVNTYIGFDPTAPSLHVGSLVQIMLLRRMQQSGHKPIALMGGGTGPRRRPERARTKRRKLMTDEVIERATSRRSRRCSKSS